MTQIQPPHNLSSLEQKISVTFKNQSLVTEALTHRSFLNELKQNDVTHNERLEFLGDAVLELVTTEFLFKKYPQRPEGELTSFRAALVRTESLAITAQEIELGQYIFMSRGEEATGGRKRQYILANAVEALIGAIYLDQGLSVAEKFIGDFILIRVEEIVAQRLDVDPKSKLQEVAQDLLKSTPQYQLVKAIGPDHNKEFEMEVIIAGQPFARGKGHSKQEAEQNAAREAIADWNMLYQKYQDSVKINPV